MNEIVLKANPDERPRQSPIGMTQREIFYEVAGLRFRSSFHLQRSAALGCRLCFRVGTVETRWDE